MLLLYSFRPRIPGETPSRYAFTQHGNKKSGHPLRCTGRPLQVTTFKGLFKGVCFNRVELTGDIHGRETVLRIFIQGNVIRFSIRLPHILLLVTRFENY